MAFFSTLLCRIRTKCYTVSRFSISSHFSTVNHDQFYETIKMSKSPKSALTKWKCYQSPLLPKEQLKVFKLVSYKALHLDAKKELLYDANYETLCQELTREIQNFPVDDVVSLMWLIARVGFNNKVLIDEIINCIEKNVSSMDNRTLGTVMWSLGTLQYSSKRTKVLIDAIINKTVLLLRRNFFEDDRSLVNICWCLATLKKWPPHLSPYVQAYIKDNIDSFKDIYLITLVWSLQQAGVPCEQWLLKTVSKITLKYFHHSKILTLTSSTLGKANYYDETFYSELAHLLLTEEKGKWYSPYVVTEVLWCLSQVRYYDNNLMNHLANVVLPDIKTMFSHHLGTIAHAYASLNCSNLELLDAIVNRIISLSKNQLNVHAVMKIAWLCLVSNVYPEKFVRLLHSEKFTNSVKDHGHIYTAQMIQFNIATTNVSTFQKHKFLLPEAIGTRYSGETTFHNHLLSSIKALFNVDSSAFVSEARTTSCYTVDVEILLDSDNNIVYPPKERKNWTLEGIKELCQQEHISLLTLRALHSSNGQYNLASDWYTVPSNVKRWICIEADGPSHFAVNNNHILGRTALKHRQLKALGWEVIQVPHFEWSVLDFNISKHINYLSKKIFNLHS